MIRFRTLMFSGIAIVCGLGLISAQDRPALEGPESRLGAVATINQVSADVLSLTMHAPNGQPLPASSTMMVTIPRRLRLKMQPADLRLTFLRS